VFPPNRIRNRFGEGKAVDVRRVFRRIKKAAGVNDQGMHDLRHHYLSWFAYLGVRVHEIQEIAGHQDLSTTQRYLHASSDDLERARELLDAAEVATEMATEMATGGDVAKEDGVGNPHQNEYARRDSNSQPSDPKSQGLGL